MTRFVIEGSVEDLGYVRTRHLSIFRAFSLSNVDASLFLCALEAVDVRHRQYIDLSDFIENYCGEWGEQFLYLWRGYHPLAFPEYYNRNTVEQENGKSKITFTYKKELEGRNIFLKPSYADLSCFLLFTMTLPENDLAYWLYWLWYYRPRVSPDVFSLCAYVREFWGESTESHAKSAVHFEEVAQKSLELVIMKDFNVKSFQLYDWKTGGAWTQPFRKLYRQVRHSFIGTSFWHRIAPSIQSAGRDVHSSLHNLNDAPLPIARERRLANDSRPVPEANDTGERKVARRDLRRFLRVFRTYFDMPVDDTIIGGSSDSIVAKAVQEFRKFMSDLPGMASTAALFKKSAATSVAPAEGNEEDALVAPEDLDYKYRESLTTPIANLLNRVKSTKEDASKSLAKVDEDIKATIVVSQAAEALAAAAAAEAAAKAAGKAAGGSSGVQKKPAFSWGKSKAATAAELQVQRGKSSSVLSAGDNRRAVLSDSEASSDDEAGGALAAGVRRERGDGDNDNNEEEEEYQYNENADGDVNANQQRSVQDDYNADTYSDSKVDMESEAKGMGSGSEAGRIEDLDDDEQEEEMRGDLPGDEDVEDENYEDSALRK